MLITCKCLNVQINVKNTDLQVVDNPQLQLGLSGVEQITHFFKEDICTVELIRISKEQASLVQVQNVGNWVIHRCLNCSMNTHSIHRDRGAACVLVNKNMQTNPADIAALKASSKYSKVFRVITDSSNDDLYMYPQAKSAVGATKAALAAIQLQLGDAIQQEASRIEEKLRSYSEQQYAELEEFREKAHRDHRALVRIISEADENVTPAVAATNPTFMETQAADDYDGAVTPLSSPVHLLSTSVPRGFTLPFAFPGSSIPLSPVPITDNVIYAASYGQLGSGEPFKSTVSSSLISKTEDSNKTEKRAKTELSRAKSHEKRTDSSLDAEGLFDLDGMDDDPPAANGDGAGDQSDEEDSEDSGSHDEGIHIPRGRAPSCTVAKSLPVRVPMFRLPQTGVDKSEENEVKLPQDTTDIAASIKALARSVHGGASVFGELPRPRVLSELPRSRFSTQF